MKRPRLTTTGFLRASRSTRLAVKSCGRNHEAWANTASRPMASGLVVSLLTKRGRMVALDIKLAPNQKNAPSRRLTEKFHR